VAATIAFFFYFTSELKRLEKKTDSIDIIHSIKALEEQMQVGHAIMRIYPFASKGAKMSCSIHILTSCVIPDIGWAGFRSREGTVAN
jgi:hypothetical protein